MKTKSRLLLASILTTVLLAVIGCATTREAQTTELLIQAGFKTMPASTFEKQQHLKSIKPDRISTVKGGSGQVFYVYPLHAKNQLYVGKSAEYNAYQSLLQNLRSEEQTIKVESSQRSDTSWSRTAESDSSWEDVWSAPTDE